MFFYLIFPVEYSWIESYLDNDTLWLESSLNWEDAFYVALSDITLYSFLASPFFVNSHFFLDSFTKLSFIDILFITETNKTKYSRELYDFFIWDIANSIFNKYFPAQFFFYTDYQDLFSILLHYSPELVQVLDDYVNVYWLSKVINSTPSAVFDLFSDSVNSALLDCIEYLILFFCFVWIVVIFVNVFNLTKNNTSFEIYITKFFYYLYSMSKESRVQFEAMLYTFFIFVFYWSMMIASFDDDQEELIEVFDSSFFYFFCFLILFLIYKYSQHYFAFLEASVAEGRSVSFISKQFMRDFINTFALLLRFFILLFRLNVYDTLDDFYDSYYIFVGDFDDDEYFNELFLSFTPFFFFDFDNKDDRSFSLEDESDIFLDLFYLYFIVWGKLYFFIFFILEEILRLSLAFYICYLIIFEVHAVNCSYIEDNYFIEKKKNQNLSNIDKKSFYSFK